MWESSYSPVTERFFSGVPHAHLLGVCHRALFFVRSAAPWDGGGEQVGWVGCDPAKLSRGAE
jgi:hypothetical protein